MCPSALSRCSTGVFTYLGYERTDCEHDGDHPYEDWKRWELDTPHEISIVQADPAIPFDRHERRGVGRINHVAFCATDREDVDGLYSEVLVVLEKVGYCVVEDPPCDCPEYGEGYYATFFFDPDGLKYEYVVNPNFLRKKEARANRP